MSKRSERRWKTKNKVASRLWYLKRIYNHVDFPAPENKIGRCKKHHPYDCGNANCYCCHSDKLGNIPTRQQVWSDLYMKEELS